MNENMTNGAMALSDDDLDLLAGGNWFNDLRETTQRTWDDVIDLVQSSASVREAHVA